jgi:hypothetical protein
MAVVRCPLLACKPDSLPKMSHIGRCRIMFVPFRAAVRRRTERSTFPFSHVFHSVGDAAARFCWTFHVQNFIFLALQIVVVHKKVF